MLVSGVLAAWATAWLRGAVPADDVVDAVAGDDLPHRVLGLGVDAVPLAALLVEWRRRGGVDPAARAIVPAPGDVRGVPGPAEFREEALAAGQAAFAAGLGVVPELVEHGPSSAPPSIIWHAYEIEPAPLDYVQLGDAQYDLTTAIRECASELARAEVAGHAGDPTEALRHTRRLGEHINLPTGYPPRAVALVAQAERMAAVLELAEADPVGGAIDAGGVAARSAALRPLAQAVRRALIAGYNALAP